MRFAETKIPGVFLIEPEPVADERGFFARTFCRREFEAHGLDPNVVQCSVSYNHKKGTLRGMHYQAAPHAEAKVVSCLRGRIYDVALDLRESSRTYRRWVAHELSADNRRMLYVPAGVAHGFQTLEDGCEVSYRISGFYVPEAARGVRWDDPNFDIAWPLAVSEISARDRAFAVWRVSAADAL